MLKLFEKFITVTFTQDGAILKVLYDNPSDLVFQHIPVREKVRKTEINRMRNGFFIDKLNSIDIQQFAKLGGKVTKLNENVFYRGKFKLSPI